MCCVLKFKLNLILTWDYEWDQTTHADCHTETCGQYPKIGKWKYKPWNSVFFHQRHALWTSFDIFVVTYRVTNFLPKTGQHPIIYYGKKMNFHILNFPIFGHCRHVCLASRIKDGYIGFFRQHLEAHQARQKPSISNHMPCSTIPLQMDSSSKQVKLSRNSGGWYWGLGVAWNTGL